MATREWYEPGDPTTTIESAHARSAVTTDEIVGVLADKEFDAPRRRIHQLVTTTISQIDTGDSPQESIEVPDEGENGARAVDVTDVEYLADRSLGRLVGALLAAHVGNTRLPDRSDAPVDCYWNRQRDTVALRTVAGPATATLQAEAVKSLAEADVSPKEGRSPSVVILVTTKTVSEAARTAADQAGIRLCGRGIVAAWLDLVRTDHLTVEQLLDNESDEESPTVSPRRTLDEDQLLDDPPLPIMNSPETVDVSTDAKPQPAPTPETSHSPGEKGVLYADPGEDGDYGAFDDYMQGLNTEDDQ